MKKSSIKITWLPATDIKQELEQIINKLRLSHINISRIICFRSQNSKSRARARIWSLPRIWQLALNIPSHYIVEVLSEKYDILSDMDKQKVLIHELLHIPKTFSGSLVPHKGRYHRIDYHIIEKLYKLYRSNVD